MQEDEVVDKDEVMEEVAEGQGGGTGKYEKLIHDGENKYKLTGMYKDWFLDYASYVILERAVPHMYDGLKPVQRRILQCRTSLTVSSRFRDVLCTQ